MEVVDERKEKGIIDETGPDISPINNEASKYDRGKQILAELTKMPQDGKPAGYAAFAPVIEVFLKEHLFADIFERDILTYAQRELVTVSVISAIGGAEPMLRSHLNICLNVGLSPQQLKEFVEKEELNVEVKLVAPELKDDFFVCLLGRRYPSPNLNF